MRAFIIFLLSVALTSSASLGLPQQEGNIQDLDFDLLTSHFAHVMEKVSELIDFLIHQKDLMVNLKALSDIANIEISFSGLSTIGEELKQISDFLVTWKEFLKLQNQIKHCEENDDPNLTCGQQTELEEIRETLIDGFKVYKVKYEPLLEYLHHAAEFSKQKVGKSTEEIVALKTIVEGTQKIKRAVDSVLILISSE